MRALRMTAIKTFSSSFDTANNFPHTLTSILIKFREKKDCEVYFAMRGCVDAILSYFLLTNCCCRSERRKYRFIMSSRAAKKGETRKYCAWLQLSSRTEPIWKIIFAYRSIRNPRFTWLFPHDMYLCLFYVHTIHRMYFSKTFACKFDVWSECILRWMASSNIISIFRLFFHESFMPSLGCRSAGDKAMKCLPWIIEDFSWPSCIEFLMQTSSNIHDDILKRESEREAPGKRECQETKAIFHKPQC